MKRVLILLLLLPVLARADPSAFGGAVGSSGARGVVVSVKDNGALADAIQLGDATNTDGTAVIHSPSYTFTAADVGKAFVFRGKLGADGVSPWNGTIVSVSGGDATGPQTTLNCPPATCGTPLLTFGTDNVNAFNATVTAVPAAGGTLYIPSGSYFIGNTTYTHVWSANRSNINIIGEGMGRTVLYYSSVKHGGDTTHNATGSGLFINGSYSNIAIQDFTISDLCNFHIAGGANPSAICTFGVSRLTMQRVEMLNAKGNSAFNAQGAATDLTILDCIASGDTAGIATGNGTEGDGFNAGNYTRVNFQRNYIFAPTRHGYEGGGNCYDQYFAYNTIDMNSAGISGINPTGGNNTVVANNVILNMNSGNSFGIDFTTDVGSSFTALNNVIQGNYVSGKGLASIRMQNTSGDTTNTHVNNFVITNNMCVSSGSLGVGSIYLTGGTVANDFPNVVIADNYFRIPNDGTHAIVIFNNPISMTPPAGRAIVFRGNTCNANPLQQGSSFSSMIVEDNVITEGYGNGANYGQVGVATGWGSIAAGATGSATNGLSGARATLDTVVCVPQGPTGGLVIWGAVSSNDNVTVYVYNPTGGALTPPNIKFYAKRAAANF
jgi:hypothetical protein